MFTINRKIHSSKKLFSTPCIEFKITSEEVITHFILKLQENQQHQNQEIKLQQQPQQDQQQSHQQQETYKHEQQHLQQKEEAHSTKIDPTSTTTKTLNVDPNIPS